MGTGTGEVPLGRIDRWNYRQRTGFYEGECEKISGSAGEFWPPNVSKEDISLFSPDMCREVGFQFKEEVVIHGITGYKFVGGEKTMDNGKYINWSLVFPYINRVIFCFCFLQYFLYAVSCSGFCLQPLYLR